MTSEPTGIDYTENETAEADRTRRRSMSALFGGVALTSTAWVASSTAATLIAGDAAGAAWSGAPNAAGVLGTALGTSWLAARMARTGRRYGLLLGYGVSIAGAVVAVLAAQSGILALLAVGMLLLGVGNGGAQLSRYVAADLYPPHRRSAMLSIIVWSGTIGALTGPALLTGTADLADRAGFTPLAGPFLLAVVVAVVTIVVTTAVAPATPADVAAAAAAAPAPPVREMLRLPATTVALITMISGQVSMVAVMTMTPLHLHQTGHGLGTISSVLTAHLLGMFALSPLTGRLADRIGGYRTSLAGFGTLLAAVLCAAVAPDGAPLFLSLFLLGYGWNLALVGGSSLLTSGLTPSGRTRLQGVVDSASWTASAVASIVAGILLGSVGFGSLAAVTAVGLALAGVSVLVVGRRARIGAAPSPEPAVPVVGSEAGDQR